MSKKPWILYARRDSGSFAVEVALEELQLPYERVWINKDKADVERLCAVNPAGKIPVLVLPDGTVVFESAAMLIHLSLAHPAGLLAPVPGSSQHARFLQWMVFLSANVYESVLRIYYPDRYSPRGVRDAEAIKQQGIRDFVAHLSVIDRHLEPYVLGREYSIADVYLYMLAAWYPGDKTALYAEHPALHAHATLIAARPSVRAVEAVHSQ